MKEVEVFKNIQELIRFTDQKAGVLILAQGVLLGIFARHSSTSYIPDALDSNLCVCSGAFWSIIPPSIFLLASLFVIFFTIIGVLKPRLASNYEHKEPSLIYFEHIASMTKTEFITCWDTLGENQKDLEMHYAEQIHEISKILKKKIERTDQAIRVCCISLISFLVYLIIDFT